MKKIIIALYLALFSTIVWGEPSQKDPVNEYKIITGESLAVVMDTFDKMVLESAENNFRQKLKSIEELTPEQIGLGSNITANVTFTQKTYISKIVKDMYYSEIRPVVRETFSKMSGAELALLSECIEKDDTENPKADALIKEAIKEFAPETNKVVEEWVMQFAVGCTHINKK